MRKPDPAFTAYAIEHRAATQHTDSSRAYGRIDPATQEQISGWCGLEVTSADNLTGLSVLRLDARAVLLGRIELTVETKRQGVGSTRALRRLMYVFPSVKSVREFAARLLETADCAEEIARASGPSAID